MIGENPILRESTRGVAKGAWRSFRDLPMARRIVFSTCALLALLHLGNALLLVHFYSSTAAREEEARDAHATLLAEHASRTINAIDLSLEIVVHKVRGLPEAGGPSVFVQMLLDDQMRRLPQLRGIIVLDRWGSVVQDSREYPPRPRSVADRAYFSAQQSGRGVGLYVDRTERGRYDGKLFFALSQPILDGDGNFKGVVAAIADPDYFSGFYGSHEPWRSEAAILARTDGAVLAAVASTGAARSALDATVADFVRQKPGESTIVRPVPSLPLEILMTAPSAAASPAFRAFVLADAIVIVTMTLVALWLARLLAREAGRRDVAEMRLQGAIRNAPAGFALYDPKDRLVLANELFRSLHPEAVRHLVAPGIAFETLIRVAMAHDAFAPDPGTDPAAAIAQRLEKHRSADGELVQRLGDGRWILTREHRADDGSVVCFHTDITEMKAQEEALMRSGQAERAARQRAEAADVAKSAFLATMSHELRTPLNAVIGFSEIMEQKLYGGIDRRYHEYSTLIRESGQHLLSIINDILDIAKLQSGKTELRLELVDVAQVIGEALRLVSEQAQSALIALDWESRGGLRPIEADIVRLRQVLLNLLSNAIKFTPEGGRVVIRARMDGGLVRIDVRDTGIGMAREDIPKALEPFGQIDNALTRQQQGTGLGLPLAKNLVELHGGRFEIASEPGAGTEVSILFPAAPQPRAAPATAFALPGLAGRD